MTGLCKGGSDREAGIAQTSSYADRHEEPDLVYFFPLG